MAGELSNSLAELTAEERADLPDFNPNIYKVVRALRKDDHGPYNCLASIVHDAAFVKKVVLAYDLPTFANLRCGLWYAGQHHGGKDEKGTDPDRVSDDDEDDIRAPIEGTCYFKSTDGHCNNWSFSGTRLNFHVAETAARNGGCLIVDATRSTTKRFPDSLSKTVPIWAETLNRVLFEKRRGSSREGVPPLEGSREERTRDEFRSGPHFPPWVGEQERERVRALLPGFENQLNSVSPDLTPLARIARSPFRCVWISQDTLRRGLPLLSSFAGSKHEDASLPFIPLFLVSASAPMRWHGERKVTSDGASFAYVPGAGDDEETWAGGLTADAFWRRRRRRIASAEPGGRAAVPRPFETRRDAESDDDAARGERQTRGRTHPRHLWDVSGVSDARRVVSGCFSPEQKAAVAEASGLPLGAVADGAVRRLGGGVGGDSEGNRALACGGGDARESRASEPRDSLSNSSPSFALRRVALSSARALSLAETWEKSRAVLCVGDIDVPEEMVLRFAASVEDTAAVSDEDARVGAREAHHSECVSGLNARARVPFLRVKTHPWKFSRTDFLDALPVCLGFVRKHVESLEMNPDADPEDYVLIACADGADQCVGIAVAHLIASEAKYFSETQRPGSSVTKDLVRRNLARVSAKHPEASPSRGTLKQVYHYLAQAAEKTADRT